MAIRGGVCEEVGTAVGKVKVGRKCLLQDTPSVISNNHMTFHFIFFAYTNHFENKFQFLLNQCDVMFRVIYKYINLITVLV